MRHQRGLLLSSLTVFATWPSSTASLDVEPSVSHVQAEATCTSHTYWLGVELPLVRTRVRTGQTAYGRRSTTSEIGLGDSLDVTYSALVDVGGTLRPLVLDTGSADLWVFLQQAPSLILDAYGIPQYANAIFQATSLSVNLIYGDSHTRTQAKGLIGFGETGIAGFPLRNQYFALVSSTNTSVVETGSSGILGLGFPLNSVIWNSLLSSQYSSQRRATAASSVSGEAEWNFVTHTFPDLSLVAPKLNRVVNPTALGDVSPQRSSAPPSVEQVLETFSLYGPPVARLAALGAFAAPMFSISLQRDTVDIGGNSGTLTLGALPQGVSESKMTWVNVRTYSPAEGGLAAPASSPGELYPLAWEIPIDDIYFDGQQLPRSNLSSSALTLTALIDTGSSLVRGPQDVLNAIYDRLGAGSYPCAEPHTLAFSIGGQVFPLDSRDFGSQTYDDTPTICTPNLASADPPTSGFQYAWSLGDPFLKGTLATFYYGNLTYPSQDPPRIGFLSTVPPDANLRLAKAVDDALAAHMMLPAITESPPLSAPNAIEPNTQVLPKATARPSDNSSNRAASGLPHPSFFLPTVLSLWLVGKLYV